LNKKVLCVDNIKDRCECIVTVNDFVHDLGIDNLNLFKIEKYLKESRLAQKLNGFVVDFTESVGSGEQFVPKHVSALQQVQAFLMSLTNSQVDGRILVKRNGMSLYFKRVDKNEIAYRYVLLNPAGSFKDIVDDAKAVVLAGGTMDPIQDFISQLYPHIPKNRLSHFSCGHVVPKSSLLTLCIGKSIDGSDFLFNHENRSKKKPIVDLGLMLEEYARIVPGGIVVFFSSYSYLDFVHTVWKESGSLDRINCQKRVFMEPQGSSESDKILKNYESCILNRKDTYSGAILLAVVGGKVSEGINFSDDLGRAVFVIGLPFPNLGSIELQEKLKYLGNSSQEYYENLCMRAVNQSIGRAIRHIKDYSSIILIDSRWNSCKIFKKLPEWILSGNISMCDFSTSLSKVSNFFNTKEV
jgi:chromosome transmission fidelity protein 1